MVLMILHLQFKVSYLMKNVSLASSKAAQLNITHNDGDAPNSFFTVDDKGNLREMKVERLNSLIKQSIESRAQQLQRQIDTNETKITNAQRNSRKDSHDIRIGNKWLSGNNDNWIRITTGEGNSSYADSGLACKNLWSNGTIYMEGNFRVDGKTYSKTQMRQALDLALNSVQKGEKYWLRAPNFGNREIGTNGCDTKGGHNDKTVWCDRHRGGTQITLN